MTTGRQKLLSRQRLVRLMGLARGTGASQEEKVQALPFDWTVPYHFNAGQAGMISELMSKINRRMVEVFSNVCQAECGGEAGAAAERLALRVSEDIAKNRAQYYFMPLWLKSGGTAGFLSLGPEAAGLMVNHVLRDADSTIEKGRKLSQLEMTLLMDVFGPMVDAIIEVLGAGGIEGIRKDEHLAVGEWPGATEGMEDCVSVVLQIEDSKNKIPIELTLLSKIIEPAAGMQRETKQVAPEQLKDVVLEKVEGFPVEVWTCFCRTAVKMDEMMELEPGDVLLLGTRVDEPVEVMLGGKRIFEGYPAASDGRYAVVIKDRVSTATQSD